jgi:CHAD domain-containing protein
MQRVRAQLEAVRARVPTWPVDELAVDDLLDGLEKTYKRGRQAFEAAYDDPTAARFHQWRKRVKYGRYQARLVRDLWEEQLQLRRKAMHELSDLLGEEHDLAQLEALVRDDLDARLDEPTRSLIQGLSQRRRAQVRTSAAQCGARLFAEPASKLTSRLRAYASAVELQRSPPPPAVATPEAAPA